MTEAERAAFADPRVVSESDPGVKRAIAAIIELEQKRDGLQARLQEIRAERDEISFDAAFSRGQSPSRRSFERLMSEAGAVEGELVVIESALKTCASRVAAARERAQRTTAETEAQEAIEIAEELRRKGVSCAESLARFAREYVELSGLVDALRRLNYGPSNSRLVHLQAERALSSVLLPTRLTPQLGALPPSQRTSLAAVAEQLAASVIAQAKRIVGGEAA